MNAKYLIEPAGIEIRLETDEQKSLTLADQPITEIQIDVDVLLERLLFVSDKPIEPATIAKILNLAIPTL